MRGPFLQPFSTMLWQNRIISAVQNFKLGYNVQRPYPWRGTTPIVCIFFVGLTTLLVFVNIPLSAYDVVQEFTYHPNDTSSSLPFTNIIPASLRHTPGDFTPQTFRVGDTIKIDSSVFDYVIVEAFPSGSAPTFDNQVGLFQYYNNPLSSCDVLSISLSLRGLELVSFSVTVSCWIPTNYKMTLNISHESLHDRIVGAPLKAIHDLDGILRDLEYGWSIEKLTYKLAGITYNVTGIDLESVFPCCVCLDWSAEPYIQVPFPNNPFLNDHPPCDDDVAKFQGTTMVVYFRDGGHDTINISQDHSGLGSILPSNEELKVSSVLRLVLQNAFQAIYNMVRLDLGVAPPNQIFASPTMFNKSISAVSLPLVNGYYCDIGDLFLGQGTDTAYAVNDSFANCIRRVRSNSSLDTYSDDIGGIRVPSVSYLRPVFRRKSMASAISSVFVATFAMVSAAWSLFHFIAGSFCQTQSDVSGCPHCNHYRIRNQGDSESLLLSRRNSRYETMTMGGMQEHGV